MPCPNAIPKKPMNRAITKVHIEHLSVADSDCIVPVGAWKPRHVHCEDRRKIGRRQLRRSDLANIENCEVKRKYEECVQYAHVMSPRVRRCELNLDTQVYAIYAINPRTPRCQFLQIFAHWRREV